MTRDSRPIGDNPSMTVAQAQDAMAATLGDLEKLAWHFFSIARNLDVDLEDEDFPELKPGPDHLRFFTALACMGTYYALLQLIESVRDRATSDHSHLMRSWEKDQELKKRLERQEWQPHALPPRKPAEAAEKAS